MTLSFKKDKPKEMKQSNFSFSSRILSQGFQKVIYVFYTVSFIAFVRPPLFGRWPRAFARPLLRFPAAPEKTASRGLLQSSDSDRLLQTECPQKSLLVLQKTAFLGS